VPQYPPQAVSMSRSSSTNVSDIHARPPSSIGQHPAPSMTPQSQNMVTSTQPGTPSLPQSPYGNRASTKRQIPTKAIEIKHPTTGATVKIDPKPPPSPVVSSSAPVIVSSPGTAPGRASSRPEAPHSRSTSRSNKSTEEKRAEMREKVMFEAKKLEAKKAEEEEKRRKEEEAAKAEEERKRKAEEAEAERLKKLEEEKARLEAEQEKIRQEQEAEAEAERLKKLEEEKARIEAEEKLKKEAEEKACIEEEIRQAAEAEKKAEVEAQAQADATKAPEIKPEAENSPSATPTITPASTPKISTPDSEVMPPPSLKSIEKTRSKPSPLNLQIKTNEPGPPSAALTALRSARPVDNLRHLQYPEGIQSPNPALNPLANATKFKYDKEFLMQFQGVFTDKPSVDWDQRMRETVGDAETTRPGTARTLSGMGTRSTSSRGSSGISLGGGAMGSFVGSFAKPAATTSMERFQKSTSAANPFASMGSMSRPGAGLVRANSSTSLAGSASNTNQLNSRPSNRSARGSKKGTQGVSMERSDSRQGALPPAVPATDVKPLPVSANRWQPRSVKQAAAEAAPISGTDDNRLSPDLVQRKVKAALNKMTPEKFDKISDQILEITAQSKHESDGRTLRQVIQLTFEKATDEAHWASMYAKFCKRMLETMDPNIKDENVRDRNGAVVIGGNLFRKYLLNRCQEEFERGWKVNLPAKPEGVSDEATMLSDEYYIAAAAKRRGLGLVQFIGELFKLNMLTERIMNKCVQKLLEFDGLPEDETVESLTKLLRTIGAQLDNLEKSKPMMHVYFDRINGMIDNKELNSRMRFMLMVRIFIRIFQGMLT
jgi:translation initiation factor 4G